MPGWMPLTRINTLENLAKPAIQALLTFLRGCITSRLVKDTGTFIPSSVFMGSTPPSDFTWVLNKFNITFPTLCTPDQDPGPDSAQPAVSPDINLNLFQHFLSALKLPGISPPPAITNGPIEPIMEDIYAMFQEEIYLCLKICRLNTRDEASLTPYLRRITGKHVSESI